MFKQSVKRWEERQKEKTTIKERLLKLLGTGIIPHGTVLDVKIPLLLHDGTVRASEKKEIDDVIEELNEANKDEFIELHVLYTHRDTKVQIGLRDVYFSF